MRLILFVNDLSFPSFFCCAGFLGSTFGEGDGEGEGKGVGSGVGLGLTMGSASKAAFRAFLERTASAIPINSTAAITTAITLKRFFARSEPVNDSEILGKGSLATGAFAAPRAATAELIAVRSGSG